MQCSQETELIESSALSNVLLTECRRLALVAQDHPSRLYFTVLAQSLKQTGSCIVERGVADHRLFSCVGCLQCLKVSDEETWYLSWLDDMEYFFSNLTSLNHIPDKPEWTVIWSKSQS